MELGSKFKKGVSESSFYMQPILKSFLSAVLTIYRVGGFRQ